MHKMTILAVDYNAGLAQNRGLYRELSRFDDLEITLIAPAIWKDDFGSYKFEREESTLSVIQSPVTFKGHPHRVLFPSLARYMGRIKPDILFINSEPENFLAAESVILRSLITRQTRVVIVSWRNIDYGNWVYPYRLALLHFLSQKLVVHTGAACIAHSEIAQEIIRGIGIRETTMIPPGVVVGGGSVERSIASPNTDFSIGYVGRLSEQKGIADLFHAAAMLNLPWRLIVVGEGEERRRLDDLSKGIGIADRILWRGGLRKRELEKVYATMDVLVLPSRTGTHWKEQFGRVLIEAMASGVAVIGSNSGEIPNVIGDAGIVFPEGNIQELAGALRSLQEDVALRKNFAMKGLHRVKTRFALVHVAARYRDFFRQLVVANAGESVETHDDFR